MDNTKLIKTTLNIIPFIYNQVHSVTAKQLREIFNLKRKELEEILDFVLHLGYPPYSPENFFDIWIDEDNPGEIRIFIPKKGLLTMPVGFTQSETFALLLGFNSLPDAFKTSHLRDIVKKLQKSSMGTSKNDLNIMDNSQKIHINQPKQGFTDQIFLIENALRHNRTLEISYYSASSENRTIRRVDPYLVVNYFGRWYMVGFCYDRKDFRIFRFDRMIAVTMLDTTFEIRDDFNINKYLNRDVFCLNNEDCEEKIVLRFSKSVSKRVLQDFYFANIEYMKSGDLVVTLPYFNANWFLSAIRSYGTSVRVISPDNIKDLLLNDLQEILIKYS